MFLHSPIHLRVQRDKLNGVTYEDWTNCAHEIWGGFGFRSSG